jgi:hypothetical protein
MSSRLILSGLEEREAAIVSALEVRASARVTASSGGVSKNCRQVSSISEPRLGMRSRRRGRREEGSMGWGWVVWGEMGGELRDDGS